MVKTTVWNVVLEVVAIFSEMGYEMRGVEEGGTEMTAAVAAIVVAIVYV